MGPTSAISVQLANQMWKQGIDLRIDTAGVFCLEVLWLPSWKSSGGKKRGYMHQNFETAPCSLRLALWPENLEMKGEIWSTLQHLKEMERKQEGKCHLWWLYNSDLTHHPLKFISIRDSTLPVKRVYLQIQISELKEGLHNGKQVFCSNDDISPQKILKELELYQSPSRGSHHSQSEVAILWPYSS